MKLFKERLKIVGGMFLALIFILLAIGVATLAFAGLVWLLSKISQDLPGWIILGSVIAYLVYQVGLLIKWLFVEPIQQARNNK